MSVSPKEKNTEDKEVRSKFDFSIDHILNRAGSSESVRELENPMIPLSWLHCTRYCPPKIPRNQKREGPQKRQLGRHPRIPFTTQQLSILEDKFRQTPYLSSSEVTKLSKNLQLADIRVKIWFQNRRARERREKGHLENEQKSAVASDCNEIAPTSTAIHQEEISSSSCNSNSFSETLRIPAVFQNCYGVSDLSSTRLLMNFQKSFFSGNSS